MWNDPIVDEVRKVRDAHAKKFNYDLQAIAADLKRQQKVSKRKFKSDCNNFIAHGIFLSECRSTNTNQFAKCN